MAKARNSIALAATLAALIFLLGCLAGSTATVVAIAAKQASEAKTSNPN
jgi:hypothetical protein